MSGPGLIFNGSLGDELNTVPIVRALYDKYGDKVKVHSRFATDIFSNNPFAEINGNCDIKFHLRFAHNKELAIHMIDHYARLTGVTVKDRSLNMYLNKLDKTNIEWQPKKREKRVVAIDYRAGWPSRRWPFGNWLQLIRALREGGFTVVAIGKTWADCYGNLQDKKLEGTNYSFEDKLDIRQTAYVLSKTNLFIGCDSGSAHLACAVGTKAITLYGPVHPKSRMHEQTIPIFDGTCTKCNLITHSEVCRKNNHMCMNNITVEHVLREVEKAFILGEN